MDQTPNLKLPYILPSQAQKHVTHNEALRLLDAVVHLSVRSRSRTDAPETPAGGDRYLVAADDCLLHRWRMAVCCARCRLAGLCRGRSATARFRRRALEGRFIGS